MIRTLMILLFLSAFSSNAQTFDSLIGNWRFKDIYRSSMFDSTKRANLREIFKETKINLMKGNSYTAFIRNQEDGTWAYDPDLRQLILNSDIGETKIPIIELNTTTLIIELDKGKSIVLEKKLIE